MTHRIGNSTVRVRFGDICQSECEVIVSSDDSRLDGGAADWVCNVLRTEGISYLDQTHPRTLSAR